MADARFYDKTKIAAMGELKLPSVTTITGCAMKWALMYFYAKHGLKKAKEIAAEAAAIGTGVHDFIIDISKGNKLGKPDTKFAQAIANFEAFRKAFKPEPVLIDFPVFSAKERYAGCLDEVDMLDGVLVLCDWKTSKAIYDDYKMQVEAYYRALLEMQEAGLVKLPAEVKELWLVQFDKESMFDEKKHIVKITPNEQRFKAFLGLRDYFEWANLLKSI